MGQSKYTVQFVTGAVEEVWAFSYGEAIILAQAEQIEKGNQYEVQFIVCEEAAQQSHAADDDEEKLRATAGEAVADYQRHVLNPRG